ncbi:hypothetical protein NPIL_700701 [Nephila pilipes]|uniref:RNase H type-1 domain-containing protein n=1 Tax=Nephila pilipes TaxID=299642 RepID=A0A8X6MXE1_NEPPI|nr:hypothetical protein NPIL_700701 [Nephila pilipes]
MSPVLKSQDCSAALFSAMETTIVFFLKQSCIYIYIDGSKREMNGVTGSGVYCEHFSHYISLVTAKSAFDGEVEAIKVALTRLNARSPLCDQAVIFSDSQAAILTIAN